MSETIQYCSNCEHVDNSFVKERPDLWRCKVFYQSHSTEYIAPEAAQHDRRFCEHIRTKPTCPKYSQRSPRVSWFKRLFRLTP